MSEGLSVIVRDIVSVGRRFVAQVAGLLAGQEHSLHNARRASTEVSRRRVERDEVAIYLDSLHASETGPEAGRARMDEWPGASVKAAD